MPDEFQLENAILEVVAGTEPGLVLALAVMPTTIGRSPGNTHVIEDPAISRQHAKIFVRDGGHCIADLHSSHGTFVNGARVTLHPLAPGDEIRLGSTVVRYLAAAARPPLPPVAADYRPALTKEGEDPFAEENAPPAAAAPAAAGARRPLEPAPTIELRGETARQFAARASGAPVAAAPSRSATSREPPAIAEPPRPRGPLSFLRDELDQRGAGARAAAALFALAAAAALFWLVLRLFEAAPKSADSSPADESTLTGPSRPVLPTRK